MPLSGTLVAGTSIAQRSSSSILPNFTDTIALTSTVAAGHWLMFVQIGGYPWTVGPCIPPIEEPPVANIIFSDVAHASFADSGSVSQWNVNANPIGYLIPGGGGGCPNPDTVAYIDDSYPNLAYTGPGLLASPISATDTIDIQWDLATGCLRIEAYAPFIVDVNAPFDVFANEPVWLEGSSFSGASTPPGGINSGTTSYPLITHATSSAASGKGAVALAAIAWDDTSQLPTLTAGWKLLTDYADATTGWRGLVAGRFFAAGDTSTYTLTATFSSSVKSSCAIDTWQALSGPGLHFWRFV